MAARRKSRRPASRRKGRVNWDRFGRVVLTIVLGAVLVSYLNPVVNFVDAWRDSKAGQQRLAELHAENARLQEEAAEGSTEAVLVREARRLGMVRPGERAYVIHNLPD